MRFKTRLDRLEHLIPTSTLVHLWHAVLTGAAAAVGLEDAVTARLWAAVQSRLHARRLPVLVSHAVACDLVQDVLCAIEAEVEACQWTRLRQAASEACWAAARRQGAV